MQLDFDKLENIISQALSEDIGTGDITSELVIPENAITSADFVFREEAIFCGTPVLEHIFLKFSDEIEMQPLVSEGKKVAANTAVFRVSGNARTILKTERLALNLIQRMSGIATFANKFAKEVSHTQAKILDTRKTTPNLRILEKYSVWIGGGNNHRFCLDDGILIKDNHIELAGGDIVKTIELAKAGAPQGYKIEVECDNIAQVEKALQAEPDIILLDNMNVEQIKQAIKLCSNQLYSGRQILLEASGGINLNNVKEIAETGVDRISIGALTHSVKSIDIGLDFKSLSKS